jgi:hypothetical protein
MATIKEKISDFVFGTFYIALFILQMLPSFVLMLVEVSNMWFWIACGIGLAALIAQAIKFPCFTTRMWNSASIGAVIGAIVVLNMTG